MNAPRSGAGRLHLRAALLRIALMAAVFVFSALHAAGSAVAASSPLLAASPSGNNEYDLGLDLDNPAQPTGKKALLTIFYDASTHGEMHPCPT